MAKSPEAFRTISEVAEWLGIQAHVLRFWESKFSQVKPIKRAGGRRYYRPTDMLLLGGIKRLLHDDGLTIKGVQKILREEGMSHVADLSQPLDDLTISQLDDAPAPTPEPEPVAEEKGVVLSFETPAEDAPAPVMDAGTDLFGDAPEPVAPPQDSAPAPVDEMMEDAPAAATEELPEAVDPEPAPIEAADAEPEPMTEALVADDIAPASDDATEAVTPTADELAPSEQPVPSSALPAFLRRPLDEPAQPTDPAPDMDHSASTAEPEPEPDAPQAPKPRDIGMPQVQSEAEIEADPGILSRVHGLRHVSGSQAAAMAPLLDRLTRLRDSMAARRRGGGAPTPPPA
ncbi:MerR family transcriptional regulator [Sulfitobacter sp. TSTF-M16]|uniref:MerR family transcriptional regulator n=1 Tax=Sulfitobacter aestuariivivens TaxID=2766981 RepID=A0A927D3Y5_9RHOB|nr:MerR family transcriptional regulator [Sulfitobacter aestuariivivens]MBD3663434.1 MerR family transcriptional regulator [Sulfitobacter aestuariivivens]